MPTDLKEPMDHAAWSARLPRLSPVRAFATIFFAVLLFMLLGSALLTFMLPETYAAHTRVVAPGAAGLQMLQSAELLKKVSQQLHLLDTLVARYGENKPLEEKRVEDLLRRSVQVRRLPGTDLVEIRAYGRSPAECAQLANEIVRIGTREGSGSVRVVERAVPPLRPVRPNKALNLALGALVGILLGTMAGGVGAKLAVGFDGHDSTGA